LSHPGHGREIPRRGALRLIYPGQEGWASDRCVKIREAKYDSGEASLELYPLLLEKTKDTSLVEVQKLRPDSVSNVLIVKNTGELLLFP
jgi:hypothetical protein